MANEFVFSLHQVNKSFDNHHVLKDITLSFLPDAKIGVIGHNGAGKSTLLRILAGEDTLFDGHALAAEGVRVGFVPQEPTLDPELDVRGNVERAVAPVRALLSDFEQISEQLAEPMDDQAMQKLLDRQAAVQDEIDSRDAWDLDRHLDQAMHALNLPPGDADVTRLSGGERRRVALCRVLMEQPDLLLLDEPTNHLDADTVAWLERHLRDYPGCVVLITHDRYFLDNVVGWMLELDHGRATPYKGNYSAYLEQKQERLRVDERREASQHKLLARELEWIRMSPRARTAKSKSRIKNYEQMAARQREIRDGSVRLHIPSGSRLGEQVIVFRGVSKSFAERRLLDGLHFELPAGGIIGVIGVNGTGKTTLLRLITGEEQPDAGEVHLGDTVELCYLDQSRADLVADRSVYAEICDGQEFIKLGGREVNGRAYVARFNFRGPDQQKKVGECSGGMRNRIQLAKMLRRGGNVILLDEPTNDLDLDTLRVLEDALLDFPGCAVVVSHDRYFINRLATHILAFEGDGHVRFFEGDYAAYHQNVADERLAAGLDPEQKTGKHRRMR